MLQRYRRRFGGIGTIVTLEDGRAFTAAHCVAAVDGTRGVVLGTGSGRWRVVKRWSPPRMDLALLQATDLRGTLRLATRSLVRPGAQVEFVGHTGRGFQSSTAIVISVSHTRATAVVEQRRGVCANDSGGPVLVDGVLVGIVTHRTGPDVSSGCSSHVVFTRLDSLAMRSRIRAAYAGARRR